MSSSLRRCTFDPGGYIPDVDIMLFCKQLQDISMLMPEPRRLEEERLEDVMRRHWQEGKGQPGSADAQTPYKMNVRSLDPYWFLPNALGMTR